MTRLVLAITLLAAVPSSGAHAQTLAFPGAEGFGRFAQGARTNLAAASVYHVTNLNDSGPGSFRDAVSEPNRFIVFDVGGIATLSSTLEVSSNLTIAGQTAPGGFVVYGDRTVFHGANNLISRHWGIHKGATSDRDDDAASIVRGNHLIFDHMSITWGTDGTFDMNADSGQVVDNLTVQNSIIGQGLDQVGHSTGSLIQPGDGGSISLIKNLWADNVTRNPKIRGDNEFINNVVYGWGEPSGGGDGYIMGDTAATSNANVEGNYFIEGPYDGSHPFSRGTSSFHIYASDNWVDTDRDGVLDGVPINSYPGADVVATRHSFPTLPTMTAQQAVSHVVQHAGMSIFDEPVDTKIKEGVLSYGTLGGVIERDSHVFPGYATDPQYRNPRARFTDADNDGVADNWELSRGLDPANPSDWKSVSGGYTRLEQYINELGADGASVSSAGGAWNAAASWTGGVPTLADEATITGPVTQVGGHAFARRLEVQGSLAALGGTVNVFDTATVNGAVDLDGAALAAGRVLIGSTGHSGGLTVHNGGSLQTGAIAGAGGAASLHFDGGVFRATGTPQISVATTLGTGGAAIDTAGYSGQVSGVVSGAGGITKQGDGELALTAANSYSGPTVIQQGTLRASSSAALASSSAIEVQAGATLDVLSVGASYFVPSCQTLSGSGHVEGSIVAGGGSVLRSAGATHVDDYALGIQAEAMSRGADWAVFNNSVHGTGAGGSYDGAGISGAGLIMVSNENTANPLGTGLLSTTIEVPEAGEWYLFARAAAPSLSAVSGDPSTGARGNNSIWVSGNASTLQATTGSYDSVQTLAAENADAMVWTALSPTQPPLSGVWGPEDGGIDYLLSTGPQAFSVYGREVGTIVDGFVLATKNLTAAELDAALATGLLTYGGAQGLSISGSYSPQTGSLLEVLLSEGSAGTLEVGATASLGGELSIELASGFEPAPTDSFTILNASTLLNQFTNAADGDRVNVQGGGGSFLIDYDYANDRVVLTDFQLGGLTGDYNGDGMVDALDYAVWRENHGGQADTQFAMGSRASGLTGPIGLADFEVWLANYGATDQGANAGGGAGGGGGGGGFAPQVPEPAQLALIMLALAAATRTRAR